MGNPVPMFVPYPFRPFWHPNSQPVVPLRDFTQLSQKLDAAEKKVGEYTRLIASLSAELRRYQDIERRTTSSAQAASFPVASSFAAHRYHSSTRINQLQRARVHSPRHVENCNPGGSIVLTSSSDSPQGILAHFSTTTTSTISAHSNPESLAEPPSPTISETATNATLPDSAQPEWFVEYNTEITQNLILHVANTFTFSHTVLCTKLSRDGTYLAVCLQNAETHVYNVMTGHKRLSVLAQRSATVFYTDARETPPSIWTVRFSFDNKYIATGGSDGQINIWEIDRKRLRASFKHKSLVRCIQFSPINRFLVSASHDNSVCMWRLRDGLRITSFQAPKFSVFTSVAFSPDGRYIAAGNDDGALRIWDARTFQLVTKCQIVADSTPDGLRALIFRPDGKGIVIEGKTVQYWGLSSREIHSGRHVLKGPMNLIFEFKGHENLRLSAVSFSSDARWVVATSLDNVYILDAQSGAWVCTLKAHKDRILGADSSHAGHYIISGGEDRCVTLWRYEMVE